ncbi:MAG: sensor histidine kinase, partial [Xanthomonadales bacterium]|nr:sensor histidine kinase [Xanthomonadales bacterium]
ELGRTGDEAVLTVSDQGPGIADDQRERVFDRFVRLEQHRGTAGTGLGLSVVRAIAIRHGADLRLESANPGLRVRLAFAVAGNIKNV